MFTGLSAYLRAVAPGLPVLPGPGLPGVRAVGVVEGPRVRDAAW
ncbi:hypothetical protein [Actinoplanes sp. NBRC 101535]|nr:hypothetical protein [Actinoplanes sp. NBRC 101535]GLY04052.1 hypothetical protein Acsp01_44310 [Actinoplanes sp. NBRC 101535]